MFFKRSIHKYGQVDMGVLYSEFVQKIKGIKIIFSFIQVITCMYARTRLIFYKDIGLSFFENESRILMN